MFGAEHVNVQPHSGSQANMAVYFSTLKVGDKILTMNWPTVATFHPRTSGDFFRQILSGHAYGWLKKSEQIDLRPPSKNWANETKPAMITAGASAYPRTLDFSRLRHIDRCLGALLFIDMRISRARRAAASIPVRFRTRNLSRRQRTKLARPPRGMFLCQEKYAKRSDSMVFPGIRRPAHARDRGQAVLFPTEALHRSFAPIKSKW